MPNQRHGEATRKNRTTEYNSYHAMISRCGNPNDPEFFRYGMKGITVCERWEHSFQNFIADMGRKPTPQHSIERLDNDKGYFPENCKWATKSEQTRNRKISIWIEHDGKKMMLGDWAKFIGMPYQTLYDKIRTKTLAEIITQPRRSYFRWIEHDGKRMSLTDWAKHIGIERRTLSYQLKTRTLSQIIESR